MELKIKLPEEYAKLYMMLFEKAKQENKNLTDEEIHSKIFMDAIAYTLLV